MTPTGNLKEFLKSVNPVTVGVLIAKKTVLECSEYGRKNETRKLQDARDGLAFKMSFMVQKFGKLLESKESGFLGFRLEKKWACPQELWYVAQSLYYLHRGQLVGGTDSEEVAYLQMAFMPATLESADRMIVPKLFAVDPSDLLLHELRVITTALSPSHVMLIDHGLYIFIWIGRLVAESGSEDSSEVRSMIQACQQYAIDKCVERGIMSELIMVHEGSNDQSVYLHLTPSHKDLLADQAAQAGSFNVSDQSSSDKVFHPKTDAVSFYEWCRHVSIEPPKVNKDVMEQC